MFPVNFECPVDITKAYEEEGLWIVEGYAATSDFDLQDDIITEEAIRASAKDLIENSTVLHNHNPDEAVGKVLESKAAKGGLFLKILISKTAPEIWQQVKEGVLNKFSVRGKILDARKEWVAEFKRYVRKILRMRLIEVSLVAVPANPKARAVRWYVEKALDEFERAGGRLTDGKGGTDMAGEEGVVFEEELLEASGEEPENREDENGKEAGGFPPPEELEKGWKEYVDGHGLAGKEAGEIDAAWVEFCKANEYPYPYPYPYPRPQSGARMRQIVALADKLIAGEKDEERKKLLQEIRGIAAGAANAYPYPAAKQKEPVKREGPGGAAEPPEEPSGDAAPGAQGGGGDVEKAGRKVSKARLTRLKKLLDELRTFIDEVDVAVPDAGLPAAPAAQAGKKGAGAEGSGEKLSAIESALADVAKRLEGLENAPGTKTSLDGQEPLPGEKKGQVLWKGLV